MLAMHYPNDGSERGNWHVSVCVRTVSQRQHRSQYGIMAQWVYNLLNTARWTHTTLHPPPALLAAGLLLIDEQLTTTLYSKVT